MTLTAAFDAFTLGQRLVGLALDDNLQRILDTTAILLFFALPTTVALGGVFFVPWRREYWSLRHLSRMLARHGWVVAGLILMLIPEFIESMVDPIVDNVLQADYTHLLAGPEAGFHHWLQSGLLPLQPVLKPALTAAYVAGYPAIIIFTPMLGVWLDRGVLARRSLGVYAMSFALALPFYLFFPVREVWHWYGGDANAGSVQNLAIQYAWVREHIYAYNELNNCFPSLHTAISVGLAAVAWRTGAPRRYVIFATTLAAAIVFSTLYLG
ncbi:MAG: phosphatase PAP2 family protein, partial [Halobacteriales archaeon]|nr:phosphatase PAP2 family protein [Halobacteriales archaeon]